MTPPEPAHGQDPADFYTGLVVEAYARLKSTAFDPAPYAAFVSDSGQPALELGCGDGDPLLALLADGLDVEGVDSSGDMLARCRLRAQARGLEPVLHHQRMERLSLPRRYRAIFLAGPTFLLLGDDETALRALVALREHLHPEGRALVPLWVPPPTPEEELEAAREVVAEDGAVLRYTPLSESFDAVTRTRRTRTRYERRSAEGSETLERDWVLHWHTRESFTSLCAEAGLRVLAVHDDHGNPVGADAEAFDVHLGHQPRCG